MTRPANCPKITVLVCALNEERNLPHVLPRIPEWVDEVILVDGHSTDSTISLAKKLCPEMKVLNPLVAGYDFAKGSRLVRGCPPKMPKVRWFGNKVLAMTSNALYGTKYTDLCSGFNAFWKSAFQRMELINDSFEMEQEMLVKAKKMGLKVIEVDHQDAGRLGNASKVSALKQGFIDLIVIIKERFRD
jgi:glycosyltransferase involved in cell wall biosynthesis